MEKQPKTDNMKTKKFVCVIGNQTGDECNLESVRGKKLLSSKFSECNEDITAHLQSLEVDLPHDDLATCPNANKRWLIRNRLQMQVVDDAIVCGKHISK